MGTLRQVVGFPEESVIPRSDGFTLLVVITVLILVNIK